MEAYRTEEEQIEAIKKYWSENGTKILLIIILGIGGFFGFQNWQQAAQAKKEQASYYYNVVVNAASQAEVQAGKMTDEQQKQFDDALAQLLADYPSSVYASYATLRKAKIEAEANNLDAAAQSLQWVIDASFNAELVALANYRLARVSFAQGDADKALALLENDYGPFAYLCLELKGDILLDKGNKAGALKAYQAAMAAKETDAVSGRLLEVKITNLDDSAGVEFYPLPSVSNETNAE